MYCNIALEEEGGTHADIRVWNRAVFTNVLWYFDVGSNTIWVVIRCMWCNTGLEEEGDTQKSECVIVQRV